MKITLLDTPEPLTIIGGGPVTQDDIEMAKALAPVCVAADGGADAALAAGIKPAAVIGDMDSISLMARAQISAGNLHEIKEQDSTDFDKVLRSVSAPLYIGVGFVGGRVDHELSAMHLLVARPDKLIVLLGQEDIVFLCPAQFALDLPQGTRVSLFPFGSVTGRSQGLNWPIDDLHFEPGIRSGTSNFATGTVMLDMDTPCMLCILPKQFIQQVVRALVEVPLHARWPVHAEQRKDQQPS